MKSFTDHRLEIKQTIDEFQRLLGKLQALEAEYLKQEEALFVISEYANDWEYWQDPEGNYLYVSPSCATVTGFTPEAFYQDKNLLRKIIHPDDWQGWQQHSHTMRHDGVVEPIEFQIITKNGQKRWIHHVCRSVVNKEGLSLGIRGSNRDITQMKALQRKLTHMAGHDPLTGLPNRSLFLEHLQQGIKEALRYGTLFAVVFIDLDGFKEINDLYGHQAGDRVLIKLAETFSGLVRKNDIIARFGGDEFVAYFEIKAQDDTTRIRGNIINRIPTYVHCSAYNIDIHYSVGMSLFPMDGDTVDALLKKADAAMYQQKQINKAKRSARHPAP